MNQIKQQCRIGKLAKDLCVERFVIRFWEKEFGVRPQRSKGGQRFYKEEDVKTFFKIKQLLYDEGFTIAGAKKMLKEKAITVIASHRTTLAHTEEHQTELFNKLKSLRELLIRLRTKL